ncbi:ABC transporter ATP-binding protein [Limosilactobacillus reuteri]|uniref:ATP-binding cassette domain-containing protein n=1 Tax=Limosilactobacillus reuteri TaxID=1598 RepID=A0A347TA68_LIMRT|nr:ABC transporter ATP-binding protein [Limosilactobacillus reuteri]AXX74817.1 ATP-binding cassette domain-containing protein [Limosilactobacillus reuteri]MRG69890.1 ATP-binding cassette domain-containing protein [Limosilactobacillus reuteri]MRI04199.1 ATP-binding cassette domain-containing protein [Limosilactobacillus reuteri]WLR79205.1 ABC transporter ATP-binding protein [Limosilactobacillus reuteri]
MLIKANNLTKRYGTKLALDNVNLQIDRGQLIAYLGTNGAGKSTTLNLLTGLMTPTSGMIARRQGIKIGVVFQDSILDKELSVKDNLNFRSNLYHEDHTEWFHHLINLMGLTHFLNQRYGTLSGGQRRRVDITRALIADPDILFLDEPTTGLDLQTRLVIWNLLQRLQKEHGLTIFLTTHYLEEAENADQMYILENGKILVSGSVTEIKQQYAPTKLVVTTNGHQLHTSYTEKQLTPQTFSFEGLDSSEVIALLHRNQEYISDFSYTPGSINDAFVKITGKELQ